MTVGIEVSDRGRIPADVVPGTGGEAPLFLRSDDQSLGRGIMAIRTAAARTAGRPDPAWLARGHSGLAGRGRAWISVTCPYRAGPCSLGRGGVMGPHRRPRVLGM